MHTPPSRKIDLDVLVLGGGVAGLWTLDALVRAGHNAALVESSALGDGQTICAQGILHGGIKYSLSGVMRIGPQFLKEMPARWEQSLSGEMAPDLSAVRVRASSCHLWRTESLKSIVGMIGAKFALQVHPTPLPREERPEVLQGCPGDVAILPETVIETPSLLQELAAAHPGRIIKGQVERGQADAKDCAWLDVALEDSSSVLINARNIVLAAGTGNPELLKKINVSDHNEFAMQRRPLHMAMVTGPEDVLPELNGHCIDGGKTRVTITSATSSGGNRVWQLGGELAEVGCKCTPDELFREAQACLQKVLPGFNPRHPDLAWASYMIDRCEFKHDSIQLQPLDAFAARHMRVVVTWPTKLVLAPRAADRVLDLLGHRDGAGEPPFPGYPIPDVALPPWERVTWI